MSGAVTMTERGTLYRSACRLVRSIGMDIVDGLALTYSCADYPAWVRDLNGWAVEDAAVAIAHHGERPPVTTEETK